MRFSIACRGEECFGGAPVHLDLAGLGSVGTVEQSYELGAPRPEQPGDPDHLAVVDVDVGRLERAAPADAGRSQDGCAGAVDLAVGDRRQCRELVQLPADHLRDELTARKVVHGVFADELAVAQHGDAVGDLVHLIEEVADEENGDSAGAQVANDREQLLHLTPVQARGRLIEDEHLRVEHHGAADGHELLNGDRVAREHGAGVDRESETLQVPRRLAVRGLPVDAAAAPRLVAEHDVLADREVRAEVDLLIDGGDARILRVGGAAEAARLTAHDDPARIHGVDAGEGFDERRLAGAVLTHQGVDLARPEREVDGIQGEDAGESDGDPGHFDDRRDGGVRGHVTQLPFRASSWAHRPGDRSGPPAMCS